MNPGLRDYDSPALPAELHRRVNYDLSLSGRVYDLATHFAFASWVPARKRGTRFALWNMSSFAMLTRTSLSPALPAELHRRKTRLTNRKAQRRRIRRLYASRFIPNWLRGADLNGRPPGYAYHCSFRCPHLRNFETRFCSLDFPFALLRITQERAPAIKSLHLLERFFCLSSLARDYHTTGFPEFDRSSHASFLTCSPTQDELPSITIFHGSWFPLTPVGLD